MKISNEFIKIKSGKKEYTLKNTILNYYLETFKEMLSGNNQKTAMMRACALKLDTPLDITEESEFILSDFDCYIWNTVSARTEITENSCLTNYQFSTANDTLLKNLGDHSGPMDISEIIGKKITAIGFASWISSSATDPILAVVDTSNYNMYVNGNIIIARQDKTTSDYKFTGFGMKECLHLSPSGGDGIILQGTISKKRSELYSIGLGVNIDTIDSEFIIGTDVQLVDAGIGKYKVEPIGVGTFNPMEIYYSDDRITSSSSYFTKANYKYIILKFKEFYYDNNNDKIYTGNYYYQALDLDRDGDISLKIGFERR